MTQVQTYLTPLKKKEIISKKNTAKGTIYVKEAYILKGNKEIIVSSVSYDESDCENDIEYVLKNNK